MATETTSTTTQHPLTRYVPRVLAEWDLTTPGATWQTLPATLGFFDVSGFTALSERLADEDLSLFSSFAVESGEVWGISILLLVVGAGIGAVGSAIAAYRFLDV